jgi:hypothetical protein
VSDDDDNDLHGLQLVVLLGFFCSVAGLLLLIAWGARPNWLWDGPLFAFAVAGGACYPARWLVENRPWWKRLAERGEARRDRAMRQALAEAREEAARRRSGHRGRRRFSLGTVIRNVVGVLLVLASLAVFAIGVMTGRHDQQVARTEPRQQVLVLSVSEDKWSKGDEVIIKVARPSDGVAVEIYGAEQLEPVPSVGDRLGVFVDPDDPDNILAADADWTMHWYWYVLGAVIALVFAGFSMMLLG